MPKLAGLGYEGRLKILQLPSLKTRREDRHLMMTYKILERPAYLDEASFFKAGLGRIRGNKWKLKKDTVRRDVRKYLFCHRITDSWNSMSKTAVSAGTLNVFSTELDQYMCQRGGTV